MKKYFDLVVVAVLILALIFPDYTALLLILSLIYSALKHIVSRSVIIFRKLW